MIYVTVSVKDTEDESKRRSYGSVLPEGTTVSDFLRKIAAASDAYPEKGGFFDSIKFQETK